MPVLDYRGGLAGAASSTKPITWRDFVCVVINAAFSAMCSFCLVCVGVERHTVVVVVVVLGGGRVSIFQPIF
jgi:hypothetical protein